MTAADPPGVWSGGNTWGTSPQGIGFKTARMH